MYKKLGIFCRGFVLIEALIALLLISVGLVAVSRLQVLSVSSAGEAKAYSAAMALSQKKLEELRNILRRDQFEIGGNSETVTGANAVYTLAWTVLPNPVLATTEQIEIKIRTSWTDRFNQLKTLDLNSVIAWDDPGARVNSTGATGLPQLISPTGDAIRGRGGYGTGPLPGRLVATNSDGTRIHERADLTTELLATNGNILLYLPPKNGMAQSFTTISGRVYFDDAETQKIPNPENVKLRLSSEGECIFANDATLQAFATVDNAYHYFNYTCYVGEGWYGNVGVVVDGSVSGVKAGPTVCVGDPQFNNGISNGTLVSAHSLESATRSYRGFKAYSYVDPNGTSRSTYLATGVRADTHYGTTPGFTAPFSGLPLPSAFVASYGVIAPRSSSDYFEQHFLITRLSARSDTCKSKMMGGAFLKSAGKYFCISEDRDLIAADACPLPAWPNFQVGTGGSSNFTVNVVASGNGTVSEPSSSMLCSSTTCSGSFAAGSVIEFTAVGGTGSTFTGWNGCTSVIQNRCTVLVDGTTTVTATFVSSTTAGLTIAMGGSGTGRVRSSDGLLDCSSSCGPVSYASGSVVTLTAQAIGTSTFVSWSGCTPITGTPLSCTTTVVGAQTVTALFTAPVAQTMCTTTISGTAKYGTISASPAGGGTCAFDGASTNTFTCTGLYLADKTPITLTNVPTNGQAKTQGVTVDCTKTNQTGVKIN